MVEHSVHTRSVICSSQIAATRPVGQVVKTPPFHGGNMGSSPVRVTTKNRHPSGCLFFVVIIQLEGPVILESDKKALNLFIKNYYKSSYLLRLTALWQKETCNLLIAGFFYNVQRFSASIAAQRELDEPHAGRSAIRWRRRCVGMRCRRHRG